MVTEGELEAADPAFEGLDLPLETPVRVDGQLQATEGEDFLWRGSIRATARLACRRCLAEVPYDVDRHVDVLLSSDPDAIDDPSVYALPAFVLCRDECAGLCPACGADLNAGPCGCTAPAEPA